MKDLGDRLDELEAKVKELKADIEELVRQRTGMAFAKTGPGELVERIRGMAILN